MQKINSNHSALMGGVVLAGLHFVWAILVLSGLGQIYLDFMLWAHMIHLQIVIGPFELLNTLVLLAVTFIIGYILGWLFAYCWNKISKRV
jgi:hypothetical protein